MSDRLEALATGETPLVALVLGTMILGLFMLGSLLGCQWCQRKERETRVAEGSASKRKEEAEVTRAVPPTHKLLLMYLDKTRPTRTDLLPSGLQKNPQEYSADLQELSRALSLSNSSIVTFSVPLASLESADLATTVGVLAQIAHIFVVLVVEPGPDASLDEETLQARAQRHLPAVPRHRVLPCSSSAGQLALVRQLSPALHVEADAAAAKQLVRHLRSIVLVSEELVSRAERDWTLLAPVGSGPPPEDAVFVSAEGSVIVESFLSLLALDLHKCASRPRLAMGETPSS